MKDMDAKWGKSWRTGFNRYFKKGASGVYFLRPGEASPDGNDEGYGVASY